MRETASDVETVLSETTLILVRHGATAANLTRPYRLQGLRPNSKLAPNGKRQAEALGQALASFPIARVYASPLSRARATAEYVAAAHRLSVTIEKGVIEADVGKWTNLSWPDIEKRWPCECAAFHKAPERVGYLGGENLNDVRARVLPCIARLIARHKGEMIAVVSHGVVNRMLIAGWLNLPLKHSRQIPQDNAAYNVIEFHEGKAKVRTVNATAHLLGLLPQAA